VRSSSNTNEWRGGGQRADLSASCCSCACSSAAYVRARALLPAGSFAPARLAGAALPAGCLPGWRDAGRLPLLAVLLPLGKGRSLLEAAVAPCVAWLLPCGAEPPPTDAARLPPEGERRLVVKISSLEGGLLLPSAFTATTCAFGQRGSVVHGWCVSGRAGGSPSAPSRQGMMGLPSHQEHPVAHNDANQQPTSRQDTNSCVHMHMQPLAGGDARRARAAGRRTVAT